MVVETFELACFVPSRADGRALEAEVVLAGQGALGGTAAVYIHPYAPLGGQMQNNVMQELGSRLDRRVAVSVAFNLRGAGRSEGRTSWTGAAEQEDLRSVLDMLAAGRLPLHPRFHSSADCRSLLAQMRARGFLPPDVSTSVDRPDAIPLPPVSHTLLCGYSYGAMLAASVAPADYPQLAIDYALVSYPYSVLWALALQRRGWYLQRLATTICDAAVADAENAAKAAPASNSDSARAGSVASAASAHAPRTLFVAGSADNFTSMASYDRWWEQLHAKALQALHPHMASDAAAAHAISHALTIARVANADHGWLRRESEVADAIVAWWTPLQDA
ncbi:hypothetical protein IWW50_000242 [Coemansia erecta]|nr:hypothetical protein GGF43_003407 [Coemansia sp. RSA 2618]KAJ2830484.1 hypothetical protein IWW50_000242 [Coemansia erecta]